MRKAWRGEKIGEFVMTKRTASARIPDKSPAFTAIPKCLPSNLNCEMEIGLTPFLRSPTCCTQPTKTWCS